MSSYRIRYDFTTMTLEDPVTQAPAQVATGTLATHQAISTVEIDHSINFVASMTQAVIFLQDMPLETAQPIAFPSQLPGPSVRPLFVDQTLVNTVRIRETREI